MAFCAHGAEEGTVILQVEKPSPYHPYPGRVRNGELVSPYLMSVCPLMTALPTQCDSIHTPVSHSWVLGHRVAPPSLYPQHCCTMPGTGNVIDNSGCMLNAHESIDGGVWAIAREVLHEPGILKRSFMFQGAVGLF